MTEWLKHFEQHFGLNVQCLFNGNSNQVMRACGDNGNEKGVQLFFVQNVTMCQIKNIKTST